ncbi:T9SS type A sorting domain-containing protein [Flavobacterium rhizosphaerae]|uniref:T9SS type A sorting domain-containing protein n=1 Tax=Flavobacterium rhizosphaerae TaxID=3163298 RepID=A0ABW8YZE8_9FLAO
MKKFLLPSFLLFYGLAGAQVINFTDQNLKTKLLAEMSATPTGYNQNEVAVLIDTNQDGEIEASEAAAIYGLNISGASISDLSGLEAFSNLEWIQCGVNQITSINAAMFPNLKNLMCGHTSITSLDVTGFTHLEALECEYAQIISLNVAGMQTLKSIRCSGNALTTIDLTGLSNLIEFSSIESNPFTSLNFDDAVNLTQLAISQSMLTELDLSHSPLLMYVGISENSLLESINLRNGGSALVPFECGFTDNQNLTSVCVDDGEEDIVAQCTWLPVMAEITSVCSLGTTDFATEPMTIYPNPTEGLINITTNKAIKLFEVYDFQGRLLQKTTPAAGQVSIDLSRLQSGEYLLKAYTDNGWLTKKVIKTN